MLKFLSEFGPLVAFLIGYKNGGLKGATIYMMIASILGMAICYIVDKKIHRFSLISFIILFISGGSTLISGNDMFIKIKPTVLYLIFAIVFIYSAYNNKPFFKYTFQGSLNLEDKHWNSLSYRFGVFFIIMALINEFVWRNFDELFWVKFKVFGAIPITIIFILLQIPFLLSKKAIIIDQKEESKDKRA